MTLTHEVQNQVPPREGIDEFATNAPLVEAVASWGRDASGTSVFTGIGRLVGSAAFQRDAERA